jgi:hypothetical protein
LAGNSSLTDVDLCNNLITDTGVISLAASLVDNRTLSRLALWSNPLTDAVVSRLEAMLANNDRLTGLVLPKSIAPLQQRHIKELVQRNRQNKKQRGSKLFDLLLPALDVHYLIRR